MTQVSQFLKRHPPSHTAKECVELVVTEVNSRRVVKQLYDLDKAWLVINSARRECGRIIRLLTEPHDFPCDRIWCHDKVYAPRVNCAVRHSFLLCGGVLRKCDAAGGLDRFKS